MFISWEKGGIIIYQRAHKNFFGQYIMTGLLYGFENSTVVKNG